MLFRKSNRTLGMNRRMSVESLEGRELFAANFLAEVEVAMNANQQSAQVPPPTWQVAQEVSLDPTATARTGEVLFSSSSEPANNQQQRIPTRTVVQAVDIFLGNDACMAQGHWTSIDLESPSTSIE
jgi:hypothetical protein